MPVEKARASEEAPRPAVETTGGIASNLGPWAPKIKPYGLWILPQLEFRVHKTDAIAITVATHGQTLPLWAKEECQISLGGQDWPDARSG